MNARKWYSYPKREPSLLGLYAVVTEKGVLAYLMWNDIPREWDEAGVVWWDTLTDKERSAHGE